MSEKYNMKQNMGMLSGAIFIFSFFVFNIFGFKLFSYLKTLTGLQITISSFETGSTESIIFGLILSIAIISTSLSIWLYHKDYKYASLAGKICVGCLILAIIIMMIKFQSFDVINYLGLGAWISILAALINAFSPKISQTISKM